MFRPLPMRHVSLQVMGEDLTRASVVLADLGIFQYEKVPLTPDARAFQSRRHIDHRIAEYQKAIATATPTQTTTSWRGRRTIPAMTTTGKKKRC